MTMIFSDFKLFSYRERRVVYKEISQNKTSRDYIPKEHDTGDNEGPLLYTFMRIFQSSMNFGEYYLYLLYQSSYKSGIS